MTYKTCKKLVEVAERRGIKTAEYAAALKEKLDVFLLNDRVTEEEYTELIERLDAKEREG